MSGKRLTLLAAAENVLFFLTVTTRFNMEYVDQQEQSETADTTMPINEVNLNTSQDEEDIDFQDASYDPGLKSKPTPLSSTSTAITHVYY